MIKSGLNGYLRTRLITIQNRNYKNHNNQKISSFFHKNPKLRIVYKYFNLNPKTIPVIIFPALWDYWHVIPSSLSLGETLANKTLPFSSWRYMQKSPSILRIFLIVL